MKQPGKIVGGLLLILIGASVLLGMIGINLGGIIGLAIGGGLVYWGYAKWQEKGQCSFGSILLIAFGAIILLGGLGGIVSLLLGAFLVYGGYKLIQPKDKGLEVDLSKESATKHTAYDTIDEEFEKLLKEGGK
ncbi:hypothetical protein ACFFHM_25010 [Halalkalibacter kiskunsagensis]|uniref:LiaF transmembrane domain-containing protein n=1 Tax=Halalkalibacter kiskunsagensis TaxID=1548599 RepID=A0ABV6KL86_9BACI